MLVKSLLIVALAALAQAQGQQGGQQGGQPGGQQGGQQGGQEGGQQGGQGGQQGGVQPWQGGLPSPQVPQWGQGGVNQGGRQFGPLRCMPSREGNLRVKLSTLIDFVNNGPSQQNIQNLQRTLQWGQIHYQMVANSGDHVDMIMTAILAMDTRQGRWQYYQQYAQAWHQFITTTWGFTRNWAQTQQVLVDTVKAIAQINPQDWSVRQRIQQAMNQLQRGGVTWWSLQSNDALDRIGMQILQIQPFQIQGPNATSIVQHLQRQICDAGFLAW